MKKGKLTAISINFFVSNKNLKELQKIQAHQFHIF